MGIFFHRVTGSFVSVLSPVLVGGDRCPFEPRHDRSLLQPGGAFRVFHPVSRLGPLRRGKIAPRNQSRRLL